MGGDIVAENGGLARGILHHAVLENRDVDAAVPDRDVQRLVVLARGQGYVAGGPDILLLFGVRGEVGAERFVQRILQRKSLHEQNAHVGQRVREVRAEAAGLLDDGVERTADLSEHQRFRRDFDAGLGGLQVVLHDVEGQAVERTFHRGIDGLAVGRSIVIGTSRRASRMARVMNAADRFGGGLVFERLDFGVALAGGVVVAFEQVERGKNAEEAALGAGVVNFVIAEDGLDVLADLRGKGSKGVV